MSFSPYRKLAVVGCGLIGGSILRGARESGAAGTLAVADAEPAVVARAAALGLADLCTSELAEAVRDSDLVVLAVPVGAMAAVVEAIAPALAPGCTVTDVGSVKGAVVTALRPVPAGVHVVPGHPIAGTEQSGPDAGFAALFHRRWTILTPDETRAGDADYAAAVERLAGFWRALGAEVETMDARHHDLVLAVTSHLPHLIAYTIVGSAADLEEVTEAEVMKFSAGGFRDFTRIAASDPTMWRDVFLNNGPAVREMLGRFSEDLQALARAIRVGDGDALFDHFTRTRAIRRGVIALGQETAEPNFGRDHRDGG